MPKDIRSFFGVKSENIAVKVPVPTPPSSGSTKKTAPTTTATKPRRSGRRLAVEDEDTDEEVVTKKTPSVPAKKTKPPAEKPVVAQEISTSDYFGSTKPKKSSTRTPANSTSSKPAAVPKKTPAPAKPISRRPVITHNDEEHFDGKDGGDDIFTSEFRHGKPNDDYVEASGSDNDMAKNSVPLNNDFEVVTKPSTRSTKVTKRVIQETDDESSDDDLVVAKPKAAVAKTSTSKQASRTTTRAVASRKKPNEPENSTIAALLDSVPLVRPPTPPPSSGGSAKFNYAAVASRTAPASDFGTTVELPVGADNCLAGMTFVFTGILKTIERGEAQQLVKRYGGKVTTGPSGKTSFVVLGDDAGPKKLEVIRKNGIRTINEEGLFDLIRKLPAHGGDGKAAVKFREQQAQAEAQVMKQVAEMEKEEKITIQKQKAIDGVTGPRPSKATIPATSKLWTVKYAPTQLSQICGNKGTVEKLQRWLKNFPNAQKKGFRMGGADGSGTFRAVMIHGPPGIGKTTAAHLVAKLEGYDIVESNASDTRSKKLVEEGLRGVLGTTSLLGYFAADGQNLDKSKRKMVLIMDEVDGMSAGDRGGVGALAAVCKKSEVPLILICNERKLPKMKPFDHITFDLPFRRPTVDQIRSRIMTIAAREKLSIPPTVIDALVQGSGSDIRQVVNMLSAAKLDSMVEDESGPTKLDFDKGRDMAKAWEKHAMLKPWDIVAKILGGGMFSSSSTATLNDKADLYFNDHEFSPLMLQENYLCTQPLRATQSTNPGRMRDLKALEMASLAAESISDGDLVDRLIHGPQQHWSLMPLHAMFSFVKPASYVAGPFQPGKRIDFTKWLGNNSSYQKRARMLKDIQSRLRLSGSGDRNEVRMQYLPALWSETAKRLEIEGKDAVDRVIDVMDSYYLGRDDFDAFLELGIGSMGNGTGGVQIPSATKAAFTRIYNQRNHPVAYSKSTLNVATAVSAAKSDKPDLEEAVMDSDVDDDADAALASAKADEDSQDITKDKLIRQPKKKAAPAAKKGGAKRKQPASGDDDDESDVEVKPKKPAKRAARAKK